MLYKEAMKQIGTRVPADIYDRMQKFCTKHSMTVSQFMRLAIESYLNR